MHSSMAEHTAYIREGPGSNPGVSTPQGAKGTASRRCCLGRAAGKLLEVGLLNAHLWCGNPAEKVTKDRRTALGTPEHPVHPSPFLSSWREETDHDHHPGPCLDGRDS